jgi:hypothetical protein
MSDNAANKNVSFACRGWNTLEIITGIEEAKDTFSSKTDAYTIESLDMSSNKLRDAGVQLLLKENKLQGIKNINLTNNDIGLESFLALLKEDFEGIALCANNNSLEHFEKYVDRVCINPKIKVLKMSECALDDSDVRLLMKEDNNIEELDIGTSSINGDCFDVLRKMRNLKKLKIIQTYIEPESLINLIESDSIIELDITNSLIGDEGAFILSKSTQLRKIIVYGCDITDEGAAALALSNINEIELRGNPCNMQKFYDLRMKQIFNTDEYEVIKQSRAFMILLNDTEWCGVFYAFRNTDKLKKLIMIVCAIICNESTSNISEDADVQRKAKYLEESNYLVNLLRKHNHNVEAIYNFFSQSEQKETLENHEDILAPEVRDTSIPSSVSSDGTTSSTTTNLSCKK